MQVVDIKFYLSHVMDLCFQVDLGTDYINAQSSKTWQCSCDNCWSVDNYWL